MRGRATERCGAGEGTGGDGADGGARGRRYDPRVSRYLLIAGFGAAGAVSRYALDSWISDFSRGQFPWGTLTVNVIGAFLLGVLVAITTERFLLDQNWRIGLGIGFLGAFTTFSTYAYESVKLAEDSAWLLAFANVFGMIALGLTAALAGLALGRTL